MYKVSHDINHISSAKLHQRFKSWYTLDLICYSVVYFGLFAIHILKHDDHVCINLGLIKTLCLMSIKGLTHSWTVMLELHALWLLSHGIVKSDILDIQYMVIRYRDKYVYIIYRSRNIENVNILLLSILYYS